MSVNVLKATTLWLAVVVEAGAALVIGLAAIEAFACAMAVRAARAGRRQLRPRKTVWRKRERWQAVAPELGADVLRSALSFLLHHDIDKTEARRTGVSPVR